MSTLRADAFVTPSTIVTDAPRMGAPRTCAPALTMHDTHDRKARDLG
jgi:hypothetical protein